MVAHTAQTKYGHIDIIRIYGHNTDPRALKASERWIVAWREVNIEMGMMIDTRFETLVIGKEWPQVD